jgi:hypothetical protein
MECKIAKEDLEIIMNEFMGATVSKVYLQIHYMTVPIFMFSTTSVHT